jgi:hypothetical protein
MPIQIQIQIRIRTEQFGIQISGEKTVFLLYCTDAHLMLLPRMLSWSRVTGSLFLIVILTDLRCVFMATSTPVIVPCT